jgi:hypothetical protein
MDATCATDAPSDGGRTERSVIAGNQRIWLDDEGIVHAESQPGTEQARAEAEACVASIWEVGGRRTRPVLVDLRRVKAMHRGARTYYAGAETARTQSAAALLVGSPLTRVIGNFFMGLNKPLIPTRLFTSEPEAMAWLSGFVER